MANMKEEFQKVAGDFFQLGVEFISFFTVKRVVTLLVVGLALVAVCGAHDVTTASNSPADCNTACPLPEAAPTPAPAPAEVPVQPEPPAKPAPHAKNITQDNWSFSLIGDGWKPMKSPIPVIKVSMDNQAEECMVFLVKEADANTTYPTYVLQTMRGFTEAGSNVDSVQQVTINGQQWTEVLLDKNMEAVWAWITVKDGVGYGFTCGCEINMDAAQDHFDMCHAMANSIQIK